MKRIVAFLAAVLLVSPAAAQERAAPEGPGGGGPREATSAERLMVAVANPHAARAALGILREGGGAVDAAIAAQMVLNLVEPQSSGIGGGAFLLHWDAAARRLRSYDGRETAPAGAGPDLFLRADGEPMAFRDAVESGLSVGTPGLLRMLWMAHQRHGRLPWARLFEPAIRLAEAGFAVSPRLHALIARSDGLRERAATRDYFFTAAGEPLPAGHRLINAEFAATLRLIAAEGADVFYSGEIAGDIVAAVRNDPRHPGSLSRADLSAYEARQRPPVCGSYRAMRVCGMGPPSSGGITVLQILGLLGRFEMGRTHPNSLQAAHLIVEASRLAFADRNRYIADSDYVRVPVAGLIEPRYLARRARLIDRERAMPRAEPGNPPHRRGALPGDAEARERPGTSHISIVDERGNAVSMTTTIESAFGSHIMVRGFLLNNELTDFSFRPMVDGRPVANRVGPGKRPRSSMAPTMVFSRRGRLALVLGSPGGSRIIGYVAQAVIAMVDWELDPQQAAALPHILSRNHGAELEAGTEAAGLDEALRGMGHQVHIAPMTSGLHIIALPRPSLLIGGADPRREGVALGD